MEKQASLSPQKSIVRTVIDERGLEEIGESQGEDSKPRIGDPSTRLVPPKIPKKMIDEFVNCNSHLYQLAEKENSESISSDGEFLDFIDAELVQQEDQMFVTQEYERLLEEKYGGGSKAKQRALKQYKTGKYIDEELR